MYVLLACCSSGVRTQIAVGAFGPFSGMWDAALSELSRALGSGPAIGDAWVRPLYLCKIVRRLVVYGAPAAGTEGDAVAFWRRALEHMGAVLGWLVARGSDEVGAGSGGDDAVVGVERVAYQLISMAAAVRGQMLPLPLLVVVIVCASASFKQPGSCRYSPSPRCVAASSLARTGVSLATVCTRRGYRGVWSWLLSLFFPGHWR
jgi:hypothetical protein